MVKAIERAQRDIDEGRLWKARDRLLGAHHYQPSNQEVLILLGQVFYIMGDLPRAALYWFLTEHTGAEAEHAQLALAESPGYPHRLPLPLRTEIRHFPPRVQERLRDTLSHKRLRQIEEAQRRRSLRTLPRGSATGVSLSEGIKESVRFVRVALVVTLVAALTVGVWLVGAVYLLRLAR